MAFALGQHRGNQAGKARVFSLMALGTACGVASGQNDLFTTMNPTNGVSQNIFYQLTTAGVSGLSRLGFAFSPQATGRVTQIRIGLQRSSSTGATTLELYADSGGTPGAMLGAWPAGVPATTGTPVASYVPITGGPMLQQGATYYLVVPVQPGQYYQWFLPSSGQSTPPATQVWVAPGGGPWVIETQPYAAFALAGEPDCYANCDNSSVSPILNVNDFHCFLNKYAAGDTYCNCDASTIAPVLNVNDFTCFINRYAAGCP
jgi:hypothetical protein